MERILTKEYINSVLFDVIGAAIKVQKTIGPGLLESVYHKCMEEELRNMRRHFVSELTVPLLYNGKHLETDFRCDLYVENCLVVELKAVASFTPVFDAKLLTYMNLLKAPKGVLINFNAPNIYYGGQKTLVNEIYRGLKDK